MAAVRARPSGAAGPPLPRHDHGAGGAATMMFRYARAIIIPSM